MKRREHKKWKQVEDELLEYLHLRNTSIKETAEQLQRTERAVKNRKQKLGLHRVLMDDMYHVALRRRRERLREQTDY